MKKQSTMIACALAVVSGVLLCLGGCNQSPEVVIYSNADEESRLAMQDALDRAGFSGQYIFPPSAPRSWAERSWRRAATLRRT